MIITLKSNNADGSADFGNTANDFTNHFPDSLILKKNSEIGVLNCTYNLQEGLDVVTGVNDTMSLVIPPNNVTLTITIPSGSYTNAGIAAAIQTAIRNLTLGINQANLYPLAGAVVTMTSKNELSIDYPWKPQNGGAFKLNSNNYMRLIGDIAGGLQPTGDDEILYYKTSNTNTFASNSLISDNGAGEFREMYGMALVDKSITADNSYFASYEFQTTSTVGIEARIALSHSGLVDVSQSPVQLALTGSGPNNTTSVVAVESVGGAYVTIEFVPPLFVGVNANLRILIPVQYDKNTPLSHQHAIYQLKSATGEYENLVVNSGAQRYTISLYDQFLFRASIKTPATSGIIGRTTDAATLGGGVIDRVNGFTLVDGSLGYILGEEVTIAGGTQTASFYVSSVSNDGEILAVTATDWRTAGRGYVNANNVALTGLVSGAAGATANIVNPQNAVNITGRGNNYTENEKVLCVTAGFTNLEIEVLTIDPANTGEINTFKITEPSNEGYTGQALLFASPAGGNVGDRATIVFREFGDFQPSIANLQTNGIVIRSNVLPIFHPLALQQNIRMETGVLGTEIGLPALIRSTIGPGFTSAGIEEVGDEIKSVDRLQNNLLIHLDNFPIKSIHKGGQGRCVAALPLGDNSNTHVGLFQDRVYNLVYHACENKEDENYNQMRVRITDAEGNKLVGLQHPVVVNLDLKPRSL